MLKRRRIDTAHNFANKPVFFACNGVQIRRRVSHKAGTEEDGRTARNSRNTSRARKKILQKAARKGGVSDNRRKAAARGVASRAHNLGEARGRDKGKGGEAAHRGGDIGEERKRGRHNGRKGSAWRSGMGAAPRACVYI